MAKREYETDEFLRACGRMLNAAGKRVADGDTTDLALLVRLRRELEAVEVAAVQGMRERHGYSWAEIGRDLGISRQAAQQFYARRSA